MADIPLPTLIAGALSCLAFIPYIASILRGETRPHLVTWWIWVFLGTILSFSYYASGAPLFALIVPVVYVLGPLAVGLMALRYGEYGANAFDLSCFLGGLGGMALWITTGNPVVALYLNLFVDFCGALPTIRKVARDPLSENLTAWILFLIANALNLLAILNSSFNFTVLSLPLYLFLITLIVTAFMMRRFKKRCTS